MGKEKQRHSARTVFEVLAVLVVLVVLTLLALVGLARLSGCQFLSIQTGSMQPAIRRGDLVIVRSIPSNMIRRGDVITFHSAAHPDQTISHRVIDIQSAKKMVQTKGDANQAPDSPISTSAVVGKVYYAVPKLGYVADFIRRPIGLALLIYVPALVIILTEMGRLARYYRKQQPYIAIGYRRDR